jgi:hypothetical protein
MTLMIAVKDGLIRQGGGSPRLKITKGRTTADSGHPLVKSHPHLWAPIRPDYAAEPERDPSGAPGWFDDAARESQLGAYEQLRRLCAGLVERGFPVEGVEPDAEDADIARIVVDAALRQLDELGVTLEPAGVSDPGDQPAAAPDIDPGDQGAAPDATREGRAAIREWARREGMEVADAGRIPAEVVEAYTAAHRA